MKNRILENYVTSILGVLIFALAGVLMYQSKIDTVAFGTLITLGLTMLRAKDSLLGIEAK